MPSFVRVLALVAAGVLVGPGPAKSQSTVTGAVNPIVGGTYQDLIWAKGIDASARESTTPVIRNPNFRNPTVRYAPFSARFGARLAF